MFTHNYLIFDEFGIKQVLCMSCMKAIKTRVEIPSQKDPDKIIRELSRHADYREIPVIINGNGMAFIMVCDDCKFVTISEKEAEAISDQIKIALKSQLEYEGKLPELIEEILKERKFIIARKAEVHEVTSALRGV